MVIAGMQTRAITIAAVIGGIFFYHLATAGQAPRPGKTDACGSFDAKREVESILYVPKERPKVHFFSRPNGDVRKTYVISGDMLMSGEGQGDFICAHYLKKGKVIATGWVRKSDVERFKLVDFGSFHVDYSQKKIPEANKALADLAKRLPDMKTWQGTARDKYGSSFSIWKKRSTWMLNPIGIIGAVGTGKKELDSIPLITAGAMATYREKAHNAMFNSGFPPDSDAALAFYKRQAKQLDVCDLVIIGFNNALLATMGSQCMGSGVNQSWPSISGIYWKH